MPTPLKRHKSLQPISREHHQGLLLAWKLREGFKYQIELDRMKDYIDWFWNQYLQDHFEFEEKYIFPILGMKNEMVIRAMKEHKQIKNLIHSDKNLEINLQDLEKEIVSHIRFEERELFQEVQQVASLQQLKSIEENHEVKSLENYWEDEFWIK